MDATTMLQNPIVLPAFFTLVSTLFAAWLNSRGVWRKQQSDEAAELRDDQKAIRDELRADLAALRERLETSERARLDQAERLIEAQGRTAALELELVTVRGLVATLQAKVGDRRRDPITGAPPATPVVLEVELQPAEPPDAEGR